MCNCLLCLAKSQGKHIWELVLKPRAAAALRKDLDAGLEPQNIWWYEVENPEPTHE